MILDSKTLREPKGICQSVSDVIVLPPDSDGWSTAMVKQWLQTDFSPTSIVKMLFQPGYPKPWVYLPELWYCTLSYYCTISLSIPIYAPSLYLSHYFLYRAEGGPEERDPTTRGHVEVPQFPNDLEERSEVEEELYVPETIQEMPTGTCTVHTHTVVHFLLFLKWPLFLKLE